MNNQLRQLDRLASIDGDNALLKARCERAELRETPPSCTCCGTVFSYDEEGDVIQVFDRGTENEMWLEPVRCDDCDGYFCSESEDGCGYQGEVDFCNPCCERQAERGREAEEKYYRENIICVGCGYIERRDAVPSVMIDEWCERCHRSGERHDMAGFERGEDCGGVDCRLCPKKE